MPVSAPFLSLVSLPALHLRCLATGRTGNALSVAQYVVWAGACDIVTSSRHVSFTPTAVTGFSALRALALCRVRDVAVVKSRAIFLVIFLLALVPVGINTVSSVPGTLDITPTETLQIAAASRPNGSGRNRSRSVYRRQHAIT